MHVALFKFDYASFMQLAHLDRTSIARDCDWVSSLTFEKLRKLYIHIHHPQYIWNFKIKQNVISPTNTKPTTLITYFLQASNAQ